MILKENCSSSIWEWNMHHESYWHFNFVFLLQNKIKVVALKITNNINVLIKVSLPFLPSPPLES